MAQASPAAPLVSAQDGIFPEEVWLRIFGALQPARNANGFPCHLLYPPALPPILPAAMMACQLFRRELVKRYNHAGQWFWSAKGAEWIKYDAEANADIELSFMRNELSTTVHVHQIDSAGVLRSRHVQMDFSLMVQMNLSKKGNPLKLQRWPTAQSVPVTARAPLCVVEVEGHGSVRWFACEPVECAVERFLRGYHGNASQEIQVQIYRFIHATVQPNKQHQVKEAMDQLGFELDGATDLGAAAFDDKLYFV